MILCFILIKLLILFLTVYISGLLTIYMIIGKTFEITSYFLLPFIIGLIEFALILCCCNGWGSAIEEMRKVFLT